MAPSKISILHSRNMDWPEGRTKGQMATPQRPGAPEHRRGGVPDPPRRPPRSVSSRVGGISNEHQGGLMEVRQAIITHTPSSRLSPPGRELIRSITW